jgi:hypothetical protein
MQVRAGLVLVLMIVDILLGLLQPRLWGAVVQRVSEALNQQTLAPL